MWKYIIAWIPMVPIAILNGALRQYGYARYMSELSAHQLSSVTAIILFGLYIWYLLRFFRPTSTSQALAIGLVWLLMTVVFEFIFGHYVMGHPWSRLFHDYNLMDGRLWLLVLAWTTLAPYLFYRLLAPGKQG
jgi:hypothetical protein